MQGKTVLTQGLKIVGGITLTISAFMLIASFAQIVDFEQAVQLTVFSCISITLSGMLLGFTQLLEDSNAKRNKEGF